MDDKKIRIEALKIAAMYAPYDGNYITGKEVHKPLSHTSREAFF